MGAEHEELQPAVAGEDLAALHHSPDQQVDVAPSREPNDAALVDDETVVVVTLDPPATKPSSFMQQFANEHLIISRLAVPICLSYISIKAMQMTNVWFLGQIGTLELAAGALANTFCNITGFSLVIGMLCAVDTLGAQAFGAGERHQLGVILQQSVLIMLLLCIPPAIAWQFTERILLAMRQQPAIANLAAYYAKISTFTLPFYAVYECLKRYLQAQNIVTPSFLVTASAVPVNILNNYIFIHVLDLGYTGASCAQVVSYMYLCLMMLAYVLVSRVYKDSWPGWSRNAFRGWGQFIRLGLPSTVMVCAEWWSFEIYILISGMISEVALAAQLLLLNTSGVAYTVALGLMLGTAVRVGNLLGSMNPYGASVASKAALSLSFTTAVVTGLIIFFTRQYIAQSFSHDQAVIELYASAAPLLSTFQVIDSVQSVGGGVLRGCGLQAISAVVNLIGYYVISLPLALVATFMLDWGVRGQWEAMAVGTLCVAVVYTLMVLLMNWQKQAELAVARVSAKSAATESNMLDADTIETGAGSINAKPEDKVDHESRQEPPVIDDVPPEKQHEMQVMHSLDDANADV